MANDTRFEQIIKQILSLHNKKAQDYGSDDDPLANVRASSSFGIPAWLGVLIRMRDKMFRLEQFARKRVLANESVEDSLLDLAVYSVIALILYREESQKAEKPLSVRIVPRYDPDKDSVEA